MSVFFCEVKMDISLFFLSLLLTFSIVFTDTSKIDKRIATAKLKISNTLKLQCSENQKIRVLKTIQGYSSDYGTNFLKDTDCQFDEADINVMSACSGLRECKLSLATNGVPISGCTKNNSNIYQVEYLCIPDAKIRSVCSEKTLSANSGYIISPGYPVEYPKDIKCRLQIKAESSSSRIVVSAVELSLSQTGEACQDTVMLMDGTKSITMCARLVNKNLFHSNKSMLDIYFNSNNSTRGKGFFLYFHTEEAPIPAPTFPLLTTIFSRPWIRVSHTTTQLPLVAAHRGHPRLRSSISFDGLVALCVVIVIALVVVLVASVVLLRRRYRRRYGPHLLHPTDSFCDVVVHDDSMSQHKLPHVHSKLESPLSSVWARPNPEGKCDPGFHKEVVKPLSSFYV